MKDLLSEYVPRVYRFALRLTRDPHTAEEIAQETFLRAWRNRTRLQHPGARRVWLFRIAANVWRDLARRKTQPAESVVSLTEDPDGGGRTPDQAAADQEQVLRVIKDMDSLPPRQRQVLYLSAIEELDHAQIAQVLGISSDAVKASLSLARKTMRRRWGAGDLKRREVR